MKGIISGRTILNISVSALVFLLSTPIYADDDDGDDDYGFSLNTSHCIASKWANATGDNISIDQKFGAGSMEITRCLANNGDDEKAKVLYQINTLCKDLSCTKAYAVGNINNHINDYTITHGMSADDYEIAVIIHSAGWKLVLDNSATEKHPANNPFQAAVESLISQNSVKVFFCQNTANGKGIKKANMIDGIGFVTAGVSAISDLQDLGYRYVQP